MGSAADAPGTAPGNVIMGNGVGIAIVGTDSVGNTVQSNVIADSQGFSLGPDEAIAGVGIYIAEGASNNQIGGPDQAAANSIFANTDAGVFLDSGIDDSIRRNFIYQNAGLGIDLAPAGPNPNQPPDTVNTGPNNLQNYPVLTWATVSPVNTGGIVGTLEGSASTTYTLDFYAGTASQFSDGSREDDEERFVMSQTVTTNASGIAEFDFPLPGGAVQVGAILRATATDPNGNTSEFSNAVTAQVDSDGDGVPDADSNLSAGTTKVANIATVPDALNQNAFLTLVAPQGLSFGDVRSVENPSPDDAPVITEFGLGFLDFNLTGLTLGQHVAIQLTLPPTVEAATSYWRYGPTPSDPSAHWYNWLYDPQTDTGAQINGNVITLHFVDGGLGDDDLTANGTIVDAGGPGFPSPFTVTTTADSGPGSLRQAILNANANPGMGDITFDIPGSGPYLIQPLSSLPAITGAVTIDGLAEPPGDYGVVVDRTAPVVELDGSEAGAGADGLTFDVAGATVQGLMIEHFSGDGILIAFDASSESGDDDGPPAGDNVDSSIIEDNGSFGIEIDDDPGNYLTRQRRLGQYGWRDLDRRRPRDGQHSDAELDRHRVRWHQRAGQRRAGRALGGRRRGQLDRRRHSPRCQYHRLQHRRRRPRAPVARQLHPDQLDLLKRRTGHRHRWRRRDAQRPY